MAVAVKISKSTSQTQRPQFEDVNTRCGFALVCLGCGDRRGKQRHSVQVRLREFVFDSMKTEGRSQTHRSFASEEVDYSGSDVRLCCALWAVVGLILGWLLFLA